MKRTMWVFTANTNDHVIQRVLETYGPDRLMYGSDFPIFRMKARRVGRVSWVASVSNHFFHGKKDVCKH